MGGGYGRMGAMPHQVGVELEANGDRIQEHTQLRNDAQKGGNRARQEEGGSVRSEERWPQHNAGDHFANDRRLPQVGTALGQEQPGNNHSAQGKEDVQEHVGSGACGIGNRVRSERRRRNQGYPIATCLV